MNLIMSDNKKDSVDLSEVIFNVAMNPTLIWKAIKIYTARRITTAKNKGRSEIAFSGKKPWQRHCKRCRACGHGCCTPA